MDSQEIANRDFNPTVLFNYKYLRHGSGVSHEHDCVEMSVIISGRGGYQIEGRYYTVNVGDVLFFNPGVLHHSIVPEADKDNPMVQFFVGFTDFHICGMAPNHIEFQGDFPIIHTEGADRRALMKLCYDMMEEQKQNLPGRYYMMRSYLVQFLLKVLRIIRKPVKEQEGRNFTSHSKNHVVKQTVEYLEEHYQEKISLDLISKNIYISPVYISKVFKEELGESPINYLIKIRLEKAEQMMTKEESLSIKQVANCVGYEDVYHFSKLFKKYYGVAPSYFKNVKGSTK